jgi:uncharacterized protein YbjT (DUF2867 family)
MIKSRIIVTGATGKTGSVVVAELLKAGYAVRAMVRREPPRGHSMWRRLPATRRGKKIWVLRLRMSSNNANNQTKLNRGKR